MNEITLNDRLKLIYPEGFRPLSEEERGRLRMLEEGPGLALSDPQRHMLVSPCLDSAEPPVQAA